jgi:hypothetical protein
MIDNWTLNCEIQYALRIFWLFYYHSIIVILDSIKSYDEKTVDEF